MVHLTTALEPGSGGAAVRTAVPQSGRRDAQRDPARRHPDARQAAAGGRTVDLGKHCGHRLPDAGCRGLPCRPGAQRLLCTGISGAAAGRAARRARPAPAGRDPADTAPPVRYDLSTRGVDPGLFPFRTWARLQKELLYSAPELLTPGDAQGDAALRQALAEYLAEYRGVQCDPEQLVVGAGLEYLLGLLAPLLPGPAAVETPGYPRARQVLENNGVPCRCLPVDADGLSLTALSASDAAVCYVTPSHQFPTGVTMPAGRRAELLHWAARAPASGTSSRTTTTPSSALTPAPCPACRAWRAPTARWCTCPPVPAALRLASALPTWCCPGTSAGRMARQIPAVFRHR